MNELDAKAFTVLFKEACLKCFGHPVTGVLSETESKQFSNQVLDQTGLVIGAKSIKNYSSYVFNNAEGRHENPSVATLDTLARYVLNAPYTDETQRKSKASHYPYWFQYKDQFYRSSTNKPEPSGSRRARWLVAASAIGSVLVALVVVYFFFSGKESGMPFADDFNATSDESLAERGWLVQSKDTSWWNRRNEKEGHLALFTLKGDNWPNLVEKPGIKNLLIRPIDAVCFTAEARLSNFIPASNWQQAGILLMEDTNFIGKSIRLSIVYNDFFGGFNEKPQIIVQAITSNGKNAKPEEITQEKLFTIDAVSSPLIERNLRSSALRIEKRGDQIRFLHANGPFENTAFRSTGQVEFPINPKYIALFALKGQVADTTVIPAYFNYFSVLPEECKN